MDAQLKYPEVEVPFGACWSLEMDSDYYYLLSGRKWSVLEDELVDKCKEAYEELGVELVYLPHIFNSLNEDVLSYNFPGVEHTGCLNLNQFMDEILEGLEITLGDSESVILRFNNAPAGFVYHRFISDSQEDLAEVLVSYAKESIRISNEKWERELESIRAMMDRGEFPMFSIRSRAYDDACMIEIEGQSPADNNFTSEQNELLDIAIDAVSKLQLHGISLEIIKQLISEKVKLSRIVITKKGKIFLPDYNKEVVMGPLPKTIFLFFLKHDEEFMFSDLMDYKEELCAIYEKVSNRGDKDMMLASIEKLIDPTNNSICEKCSAVRKAFMEQITYDVARNYFIEGKQGMPKRISLDRSLVEWEISI